MQLGDPAEVSIEGLRVVISDDATAIPVALELRNARIRAARALREAGAEVARVSLPGVKSVLQPYLNAMRESGGLRELLTEGGAQVPGFGRLVADAVRGRSPYTTPLLMTLASENLSSYIPERLQRRALAAERELAERVTEAIGDGVLLHPPFARVAPRHGRTIGRPWMLAPTALFNLLGLPVTEVPLGLDEAGLPLGVQVAARAGPRPRGNRRRRAARTRLRRVGPAGARRGPPRGGLRDGPGVVGGRRFRPGRYWTVSSPSMPCSRWLSIEQ